VSFRIEVVPSSVRKSPEEGRRIAAKLQKSYEECRARDEALASGQQEQEDYWALQDILGPGPVHPYVDRGPLH
jgi:hypothetical protein